MIQTSATRSIARGLARIEPDENSLVVFSAKPGTVAEDGGGATSAFAEAIAKYLTEPGQDVALGIRKVRDAVMTATNGRQEPYSFGSLDASEHALAPAASDTPAADGKVDSFVQARPGSEFHLCGYPDFIVNVMPSADRGAPTVMLQRSGLENALGIKRLDPDTPVEAADGCRVTLVSVGEGAKPAIMLREEVPPAPKN
jgi:hypothetical protein